MLRPYVESLALKTGTFRFETRAIAPQSKVLLPETGAIALQPAMV
jgi:hypothetical protein